MGFFPLRALFFPGTRAEGTFSELLVKSTLLGLISAESVNIWSIVASSNYAGEASVPFMSHPVGPELKVSVAGYVGRPGSFSAGWHEVGNLKN